MEVDVRRLGRSGRETCGEVNPARHEWLNNVFITELDQQTTFEIGEIEVLLLA
jgi:hypothetical protein